MGRSSLNKKLLVWVGTVSQGLQQGWVAALMAPQPLAAQFHELFPLKTFPWSRHSPSSLGELEVQGTWGNQYEERVCRWSGMSTIE